MYIEASQISFLKIISGINAGFKLLLCKLQSEFSYCTCKVVNHTKNAKQFFSQGKFYSSKLYFSPLYPHYILISSLEITIGHQALTDGDEILSDRTFLPSDIITVGEYRKKKIKVWNNSYFSNT